MRAFARPLSVLIALALTLVTLTPTSRADQNPGRAEVVRVDDLPRRVQFLEEPVRDAKLESVLTDKLHATLDQLNSTAAILVQIAQGQKRVSDEEEQKTRDAQQMQQNQDSTVIGILGVVLAVAGVFIAGSGFGVYIIVRNKLEAELSAANKRVLEQAKARTAVAIYTRLTEAYSRSYAKTPKATNPLFNVTVNLAVFFARGTYSIAETLEKLWDDDERKDKENIELLHIVRQNLARELATETFTTGETNSAEFVKDLTKGLKEFSESCRYGEPDYPWYEFEETLIVIDHVFGDPNTKTHALERMRRLLQDANVPSDWRDEVKAEHKNIGFF